MPQTSMSTSTAVFSDSDCARNQGRQSYFDSSVHSTIRLIILWWYVIIWNIVNEINVGHIVLKLSPVHIITDCISQFI